MTTETKTINKNGRIMSDFGWMDAATAADVAPADRAALDRIAARTATRLERESEEFAERFAEREADEIVDGIATERRQASTEMRALADAAGARSRNAFAKVRRFIAEAGETRGEKSANLEGLALDAARRSTEWAEIERRAAARVISEPPVYHPGGKYSWFADLAEHRFRWNGSASYDAATERLTRYGRQLIGDQFEPEGMRAARILRETVRRTRDDDRRRAELRSLSTNPTSAGSFVPPLFLVADAAQYRTGAPAFWKVGCTQRPLPDHGMTVDVPKWTLGPDVAATAENTAPTEVDPTSQYQSVAVSMYAGTVNASQAFVDRAGPIDADAALYAQMLEELQQAIDVAAINAAFAGASTVTRTTSSGLTLAMFTSDIGQAASGLATTAGTKLPARTLIAHPTVGEWLLGQTTSGGESWFKLGLGQARTDDGRTGQNAHGLDFALDPNMPASGSNAQLAVTNPTAIYVYGGTEPIFDVMPLGGGAGSMTVTFRMRAYAAVVSRFPAGVALISGNGYPSSPTWA